MSGARHTTAYLMMAYEQRMGWGRKATHRYGAVQDLVGRGRVCNELGEAKRDDEES